MAGTDGRAAMDGAGGGAGAGGRSAVDAGAGGRSVDASAAEVLPPDATPPVDAIDGRDGGAPDSGMSPRPWTLSQVLAGAPWYATQFTQGLAVDASKRVYIGDGEAIYVIDGSALSIYLTAAEAAGPGLSDPGLGDFDIGPDERLYIVSSGFTAAAGRTVSVVRSAAAHTAEPWVSLARVTQPQKVAVVSEGTLALVARDGFWTFTAAGGQLVYDPTRLTSTCTCATEDLAAAPSGVFLFEPGCNGYPLLRGRADGSNVGILYNSSIGQPGPIPADNFLCLSRDPTGGFYVVIDDYAENAPRLYHIDENAQGLNGLTWIQTVPTFAQAKQFQDEVFGFRYCSIAAASDGTVFFQTYHQLWKVTPP